jgi:hypothetical protein
VELENPEEIVKREVLKPRKQDLIEAFGDQRYREAPDGRWKIDLRGREQVQGFHEMMRPWRRKGIERMQSRAEYPRATPRWGRATSRYWRGKWWHRRGAAWVAE